MKLLIVLSLIAYGYAAKLDRTYLPPASAASAGGSPGSLTAPGQEASFGQQAPGFRGSQSQPGRGLFNQQSGASQPSFGQSGQGQAGQAAFGQSSGYERPSGQSGFGQLAGSNAQAGSNQPTGFGRPSGQPGFGQAGFNQPSSFSQLSGTGIQPAGLGVQPGGFAKPQFEQQGFAQGPRNQGGFPGQTQQPERPQASADRNAEILRYNNQNDGETFAYDFETSNGISAEESGVATNGVQAQGGYSYTGDDGQFYRITYTADENGYVPQGDHLPTPPPIPEEILKSIEENARAAASGTQEGAYNPDEDDSSVQSYQQGQQQQFRGSNGFGPAGPAGKPQNRPQGFQGSNQQGFKQGPTQPAFNSQSQQGFPSQNRPQGQNGGQSNDQSGYDYSRPQNQGRQPNGNANFIPLGPSKTSGSQNQGKPFQQGQTQPGQSESFGAIGSNQGRYQAPENNKLQRPQLGNQGLGSTGSQFNQGSQGASQRTQLPGNQGSGSQYNQNQGFAPSGNQGPESFAPNRPTPYNEQQSQTFQGQRPSQGQRGPQTSQGQRGQVNGGSQNQDGYEYNKPQGAFNSGNQGQFRPQSQGPTGAGSQGGFPGSQGPSAFRGASGSNRPSSQGQSQGAFPGSSGVNHPGVGSQVQQGFPGSSQAPQFPGPRGQATQGQQPQRPGSQQPYNPLANQTFNQPKPETFGGPRQPPSFSSEEGYKY